MYVSLPTLLNVLLLIRVEKDVTLKGAIVAPM